MVWMKSAHLTKLAGFVLRVGFHSIAASAKRHSRRLREHCFLEDSLRCQPPHTPLRNEFPLGVAIDRQIAVFSLVLLNCRRHQIYVARESVFSQSPWWRKKHLESATP
jgi:hypothetical protein